MTATVIGGVIVALVAGLFGYVGNRVARRREKADAASIITATAMSLLAPLNVEVSKLQSQVTALASEVSTLKSDNRNLRAENTGLRNRVTALERQLLELGHTPVSGNGTVTQITETKTVTHQGETP